MANGKSVPLSRWLDKPAARWKNGLILSIILSLLTVTLSMPFVSWIRISYIRGLIEKYSVDLSSADIYGQYSMLKFLNFVRETKAGILGFPAFLIFIALAASLFLHIVYIVRILIKNKKTDSLLTVFKLGKGANFLTVLSSFGTVIFILFANAKIFPGTFVPTVFTFAALLTGILNYITIKMMEAVERKRCHAHGFLVELRKNWVLFLFLIPCFIYFLINNYLPMSGIYFAFVQFNFRDGLFNSPFVGFQNFEFLVKSDLWKLTRNTILYNVVFIGLGNIIQIFFAILVSQVSIKWFKKTSQTLIFMPYFVSFVILRVLVYSLLQDQTGVLDVFFGRLTGSDIDFYNTPRYWPWLIVFFYLWKNVGYGMVIYLATIMGISEEYYEAAKIDGANIFQQIRYITIPQLIVPRCFQSKNRPMPFSSISTTWFSPQTP